MAHGPITAPAESMLIAPSIVSFPVVSETVTPGSGATDTPTHPLIIASPPLVSSPMSSYISARTNSTRPSVKSGTGHSDTTGSVPLSPLTDRTGTGGTGDSAPTAVTTPGEPSGSTSSTTVLSVLVVDDDPVLRGLLQRLLQRLGCTVEGAENGQAALRKLGVPSSKDEGVSSSPVARGDPHNITLTSLSAPETSAPSTAHTYDGASFFFGKNQLIIADQFTSRFPGQSNAQTYRTRSRICPAEIWSRRFPRWFER